MRLLLALAVVLVWPAAARAGTVEVRSHTIELGGRSGTTTVHDVYFTAAPGEPNDIRITGTRQLLRVEDAGAPLTAGPGCAADGGAVTCADPSFSLVFAYAGDGNDRIAVTGMTASLDGGAGDDVLSVSAADGYLYGRAGNDTLVGGEERDVLDGGSGHDIIEGNGDHDQVNDQDAPGVDRIDGGAGDDALAFYGRTPVHVDLERTVGISGIEDLTGTKGDDVLIGDNGANDLDGGGGNDRLEGRGGDDELQDNDHGDDVLLGGPGIDLLIGFGGNDRYDGGPGADDYDLTLAAPRGHADLRCSGIADRLELTAGDAPSVRLHPGCRRVILSGVQLTFRGGRVAVRLVDRRLIAPCRVRLSAGGHTVTLRHPLQARARRARLTVPATIAVRFAQRCGGPYRIAAHLWVASR